MEPEREEQKRPTEKQLPKLTTAECGFPVQLREGVANDDDRLTLYWLTLILAWLSFGIR